MKNLLFFFVMLLFFLTGKIHAQKEFLGKWKINRTWVDTVLSGDANDPQVAVHYYKKKFYADSLAAKKFAIRENKTIYETRMNFLPGGKFEMRSMESDSIMTVSMAYEINTTQKSMTWENTTRGNTSSYNYEFKKNALYLSKGKKKLELVKVKK